MDIIVGYSALLLLFVFFFKRLENSESASHCRYAPGNQVQHGRLQHGLLFRVIRLVDGLPAKVIGAHLPGFGLRVSFS